MYDPITRSTALCILHAAARQSELTHATVTAIEEDGPQGTRLLTVTWHAKTPCSKKEAANYFGDYLYRRGLDPIYLPKDEEGYGSYKSESHPELYLRFIFASDDGEDDLPDA